MNPNRKRVSNTSLRSLTRQFVLALFDLQSDVFKLKDIAKGLKVPVRRIYDIVNVLEGANYLQLVKQKNKNNQSTPTFRLLTQPKQILHDILQSYQHVPLRPTNFPQPQTTPSVCGPSSDEDSNPTPPLSTSSCPIQQPYNNQFFQFDNSPDFHLPQYKTRSYGTPTHFSSFTRQTSPSYYQDQTQETYNQLPSHSNFQHAPQVPLFSLPDHFKLSSFIPHQPDVLHFQSYKFSNNPSSYSHYPRNEIADRLQQPYFENTDSSAINSYPPQEFFEPDQTYNYDHICPSQHPFSGSCPKPFNFYGLDDFSKAQYIRSQKKLFNYSPVTPRNLFFD